MRFFHYYDVDFITYCPKCTEFCHKFYKKEKCRNCMKVIKRYESDKPVFFEERSEEMLTMVCDICGKKLNKDDVHSHVSLYSSDGRRRGAEVQTIDFDFCFDCADVIIPKVKDIVESLKGGEGA